MQVEHDRTKVNPDSLEMLAFLKADNLVFLPNMRSMQPSVDRNFVEIGYTFL